VPAYRLPREGLQKEVDYMPTMGVEIKLNTPIGGTSPLSTCKKIMTRFTWAWARPKLELNVPGEDDAENVIPALEYLKKSSLGEPVPKGET
jgi:glutamate synthase (NADPH/NADH) small chain